MDIVIRKAAKADAVQIGYVHYTGWLETYTDMLCGSVFANRSAEKSAAMFEASGCKNIIVACANNSVVGFCGWGGMRGDTEAENTGEIHGIYVLRKYHRMGIGQRLICHALSELKAAGYTKAALWVLEKNKNAIGFYEKMGFEYNGVNKIVDMTEPVTELLYEKKL